MIELKTEPTAEIQKLRVELQKATRSERKKLRDRIASREKFSLDKELKQKGFVGWLTEHCDTYDDQSLIKDKEFLADFVREMERIKKEKKINRELNTVR